MSKDKRFFILLLLQSMILGLLVTNFFMKNEKSARESSLKVLKETAYKLKAAGLDQQAISLYESFLSNADEDKKTMANMSFALAEMIENKGEFGKSLSWYYRSSLYDVLDVKEKAQKKIVALLEKLNKHSAAKMALDQSVSLKKDEDVQNAKILAEINGKKVYDYEVFKELDQLPEELKKNFDGKDGKIKFLQKYVSDQLLYEKALRMQLDVNPEILAKLETIKKSLLIEKIFKDDLNGGATISDMDLQNYFKANKEKFILKERATVVQFQASTKKEVEVFRKRLRQEKSLKNLKKVFEELKSLTPYNEVQLMKGENFEKTTLNDIDLVLKTNPKTTSSVIKNGDKYSSFFVLEKFSEQKPSFEQIKEVIRKNYQWEKTSGSYQKMIGDLFKSQDVKVYVENI